MKLFNYLMVFSLISSSLLISFISDENETLFVVYGHNNSPTRGLVDYEMDMNVSEVAHASFINENPYENGGHSVSGAGDVNGDGYNDILIGVYGNYEGGQGAGQTYLFLGNLTVWSMDMNLSSASASFIGEGGEYFSGYSVSGAGDVNGDGYDDFLIGGWRVGEGKSYLILGKSTGWSMDTNLSNADASFIGEAEGDRSGWSVSGAGDVNGDGYDDILIGARTNSEGDLGAGQTYLILGQSVGWSRNVSLSEADASFNGESEGDGSGWSVSGAGDVNGDGYDDILIGAAGNDEGGVSAGQSYLVLGRSSGWSMDMDLSSADASFIGEVGADFSGNSVSRAGDVNGDGYDDILIGAYYNGEGGYHAGQTYLILGKATGWSMDTDLDSVSASFIGEEGYDESGHSVSGAGDINGDGYDDILIGAYGAGEVYVILGRSSGWNMDTDLSSADASFIQDVAGHYIGWSVSGAGDVNGDGSDDILIGARPIVTYLITGLKNTEPKVVYSVDLYSDPGFSSSVSVADIGEIVFVELLGLDGNESNQDIAFVNVSFRPGSLGLIRIHCRETGNNTGIYRGSFLISPGTHYLDTLNFSSRKDPTKFDHLFIDNPFRPKSISSLEFFYDDQYSIKVDKAGLGDTFYIEVIGEDANPLTMNFALVNISSTFSMPLKIPILLFETGINTGAYRGAFNVPENFFWMETIYVSSCRSPSYSKNINVDKPFRPTSIDSLKVYFSAGYSKEIDKVQLEETIFIEIIGQDANELTRDYAFVNISSDKTASFPLILLLQETDINTGIYRNELFVPNSTEMFENITFHSSKDSSKNAKLIVCNLVMIGPLKPVRTAVEDEEYIVSYSNLGLAEDPIWTWEIDKEWLMFDVDTLELSGTPDNEDVGLVSVKLNLSDDLGHFDVQEFLIRINNTPPQLFGTDLVEVDQGEYYEVQYDCDDDGQGVMTYYVSSNADWLEMEPRNGTLFGLPDNDDVGECIITISVTDGNDGWDSRQFNLTVHNINDAPVILTDDISEVIQNDPFVRNYVAEDIDPDDELRWELKTDALFLSIEDDTGKLTGEPGYADVGAYFVNVSVWDLSNDFDFHNFTLTVVDINDQPIWDDFPENIEIIHDRTYLFDVNATDYDGDELKYSISSQPESDISIDDETGLINWTADIHLFNQAPYKLEVKVSVWDGLFYLNRSFTMTIQSTEPPVVELLGPEDGKKGASTGAILSWLGTDPEDEPITYNIYLHQTEAFVQGYREEALFEEDYIGTSITLDALDPGKSYFWTVIPNDGCSDGLCTSGVMSFRVNYKPIFKEMEDHEISAGRDFKYKASATDEDSEDLPNLRYSLVDPPEGMTISEETGMIRWTPEDDQVRLHTITIQVTDGIESTTSTFRVEVKEGENSSSMSILIIILIAVVVIILLVVGVFFFLKKKKQLDEEALKRGEEERSALEKDREDEYTSYEELYGAPAPERDEDGMTTSELKEYIHDKIQEIEE